jgi:predicted nucleic acid-binding protein
MVLDTNIILRYLTRDDPIKAAACFDLFQRLQRGTDEVVTSESVLAEVVYVLSSPAHYSVPRQAIRDRLVPILALRGLHLPRKRLYLRALNLYVDHPPLDFEDALSVAHMEERGISRILSYDSDFDAIPGVERVEP